MKVISEYSDNSVFHKHAINMVPEIEEFTLHTHDICELILLKKGDVSVAIGEKNYKLKRGNIAIFRTAVPHAIIIDKKEPYERHNILFDEQKMANGIFNKISENVDVINCKENNHIMKLFDNFDYYYQKFSGEELRILVNNTIEEIIFNLYLALADETSNAQFSVHPVIDKAVSYINEHYSTDICIEDICAEACVTQSHLHHLFMEHLNISPKKYINMKRVTKAQMLLNMGNKPTEIFMECGFKDYTTFFRNFTTYFGYSPSDTKERTIVI